MQKQEYNKRLEMNLKKDDERTLLPMENNLSKVVYKSCQKKRALVKVKKKEDS